MVYIGAYTRCARTTASRWLAEAPAAVRALGPRAWSSTGGRFEEGCALGRATGGAADEGARGVGDEASPRKDVFKRPGVAGHHSESVLPGSRS